ncbi:hypothetical protein B5M09_013955, partial [Aphanomyces astaci]
MRRRLPGPTDGFVSNAPAFPDLPSYNGSTKSERRAFIRQYNKYLDQINALQLNGSRPFVMPVSACMNVFTKKRVAMWDMANRDYQVLKKRLTTAIQFDTTILDADSRIGKMLDNLMRALERDDQALVLGQEGVDWLRQSYRRTFLKCGSENHKVVNYPKCGPGESERLLKEQMDKWESAH